jgi:hypothetical protein
MEKPYYGWAIRLPYEYDAMAGVLFWTSPPPHCAAIRTAVFETRREAREAKKRCPAGSKVVHVKVTISETAMSSNAKAVGLDAAGGQSHTSDGLCPGD